MAQEYVSEDVPTLLDHALREPSFTCKDDLGLSFYVISKRIVDVALSTFLLTVLSVPMALIALAVRLTSSGPVFFRQVRLGKDRRPFVMLKFRSMLRDSGDEVHRAYVSAMLAEEGVQPSSDRQALYKLIGDERVTGLGALLRKTSLDELPQLINVLIGDMSLVGPRPSLPWEAGLFGSRYCARFEVKPGLTGLWQVSGRSNMTMQQALELDLKYARERSVALDLTILVRTVPAVLFCRGAS
jgi:lipopolysaccharide/colanic/teichoic acid biosynthesis glycosyltransferase